MWRSWRLLQPTPLHLIHQKTTTPLPKHLLKSIYQKPAVPQNGWFIYNCYTRMFRRAEDRAVLYKYWYLRVQFAHTLVSFCACLLRRPFFFFFWLFGSSWGSSTFAWLPDLRVKMRVILIGEHYFSQLISIFLFNLPDFPDYHYKYAQFPYFCLISQIFLILITNMWNSTFLFFAVLRISGIIVTERLRFLIHISDYFQIATTVRTTIQGVA